MKALNQLKTFQRILQEYPGDTPLGKFLPGFYRQNKQMGSTDRRVAGRLIYNYFRLGNALRELVDEQRLIVAEFLCNTQTNSFLQHFKPEWAGCADLPITKKIEMVQHAYPEFKLTDVFPWIGQVSPSIDKDAFLASFFTQPDLFIRIRKGFETHVKAELTNAGITFKDEGNNCLSMPNGTRLENIFPSTQNWYEVQDASSQQTAQLFKPNKWDAWWDACAASGGKSLLLHEQEPNLKLVVSDIRESILNNLDERFQRSGLTKYQKKQLDLTANIDPELANYAFDGIILDAPCSGSGTWGRTPEMIAQFSKGKIEFFNRLQSDIVRNVVKYLKPGKPLIYITCSAFKAENEDVVKMLSEQLGLEVEHQGVIKGYEHKADTMFAARLIKPV
ncbi:RsmB/NOP family class I SAM-dependent RNA methyltransferase [Mucilaginibacter myungsuensis]|uniref:RsmB/NOP family class I SAM-dependent RNA methyltransferase n=1 Tax=Mucilaginibacter myungsuensis TaxID=649104 RepID=A0A929PX88_9SPHI|nr:RsmB/NOP family class I SAM-dependent RNA methyltransferase [Mucilaginibacter myungsuensis]MBE9663603.1 RsmB/NOP family class I SAM-dependent RNA methyltransferase [Mucilaginibacter myungsuensis]MDN3599073.1 RsmB/NOP family class I SAM-dependent RNA methyltransferase [Mucilaginibacter myungsuensis]